MAKDEQGFDTDLTYTQEDNEFWDGTDFAHPAWWRGQRRAMEVVTEQLQKIVLGPESVVPMTYVQVIQHLRLSISSSTEIIVNDMLLRIEKEEQPFVFVTDEDVLSALNNSAWERGLHEENEQ